MTNNISALVLGYGSIGKRHSKNLHTLGIDNIYVCDPYDKSFKEASEEKFIKGVFLHLDEALRSVKFDIGIICTPPYLHVEQSKKLLLSDLHVFIEKPLSNSLEGIKDLITLSNENKKIVQIGYNWRFYKGFKHIHELINNGSIGRILWVRSEFGKYLPEWRPNQNYRNNYTAIKSEGGGIIFDASHELDYLKWLFGDIDRVFCVSDRLSDLDIDVEDTASLILNFSSGCIGEVHLDFVQRLDTKTCKIVGSEGTIFWDYKGEESSIKIFDSNTGNLEVLDMSCDPNDKYVDELYSFLECIKSKTSPIVDLQNALDTLKVIIAAYESSDTGIPVKI